MGCTRVKTTFVLLAPRSNHLSWTQPQALFLMFRAAECFSRQSFANAEQDFKQNAVLLKSSLPQGHLTSWYWHALLDVETLNEHACHEPSWIEARGMLLTCGHISTVGGQGERKKKYLNLLFGNIASPSQIQLSEHFYVSTSFSTWYATLITYKCYLRLQVICITCLTSRKRPCVGCSLQVAWKCWSKDTSTEVNNSVYPILHPEYKFFRSNSCPFFPKCQIFAWFSATLCVWGTQTPFLMGLQHNTVSLKNLEDIRSLPAKDYTNVINLFGRNFPHCRQVILVISYN